MRFLSTCLLSLIVTFCRFSLYACTGLYYFHDFRNVHQINFEGEINRGHRVVEIQDIFPDNAKANRYRKTLSEKMESWKAARQIVEVDKDDLEKCAGTYRTYFDEVPQTIFITVEQNKLYYATSEFGKAELIPSSSRTFFFIYIDGIWDVEFTENSVITKSRNYSYTAHRM